MWTMSELAVHENVYDIPRAMIELSPYQRRMRHKKPTVGLQELAESIRANGVIEPCIIRIQNAKGKMQNETDGSGDAGETPYEMVAGERRLTASGLAGLDTVPCVIRELSDREAALICVLENKQREDLHPLEEAAGIQVLLDMGWTRDEAANELGITLRHLSRRVQLTQLSKRWRQAYENPDDEDNPFGHWSASYYELIARFPEHVQETIYTALEDWGWEEIQSLKDLRRYLATRFSLLEGCAWDLDDETLVVDAGSCAKCQRRSDVQPELFEADEDFAQRTGKVQAGVRCLDADCYEAKRAVASRRAIAALRAKHEGLQIIRGADSYAERTACGEPVYSATGLETCKKGDPGAVPVAREHGGVVSSKVTYMRPAEEGKRQNAKFKMGDQDGVGGADERGGEHGDKTGLSLKEKRARLEKLRERLVVGKVVELLRMEEETLEAGIVLALVLTFGMPYRRTQAYEHDFETGKAIDVWAYFDGATLLWGMDETIAKLQSHVVQVLVKRLEAKAAPSQSTDTGYEDARRVSELFGYPFGDLEVEAREAKPEPKSWQQNAKAPKGRKGPKGPKEKTEAAVAITCDGKCSTCEPDQAAACEKRREEILCDDESMVDSEEREESRPAAAKTGRKKKAAVA